MGLWHYASARKVHFVSLWPWTLTFLTSKSDQFASVPKNPNCIKVVNFVKFPQAIYKISCQTLGGLFDHGRTHVLSLSRTAWKHTECLRQLTAGWGIKTHPLTNEIFTNWVNWNETEPSEARVGHVNADLVLLLPVLFIAVAWWIYVVRSVSAKETFHKYHRRTAICNDIAQW